MKRSLINVAILGALGIGAVLPSQAFADSVIHLCAGEYVIPADTDNNTATGLNNPSPITMWGYARGNMNTVTGTCNNTPTSPGPTLQVKDSGIVKIRLHNALPRRTSLVIPGLTAVNGQGAVRALRPVMFNAPDGTTRVHSFDKTVLPGETKTYAFQAKAGSYLYQSGSHQQVQVQMGLMGAILGSANDPVTGFAATDGNAYVGHAGTSQPKVLIYSDIDPLIHAGVVDGEYTSVIDQGDGVTDTPDMKSTVDYAPKYFSMTLDSAFVDHSNQPYAFSTERLSTLAGDVINMGLANNEKPLVRMLNGSSHIRTPSLTGAQFDVIAEDGNLYPNYRKQFAMTLAPLKTKDVYVDTSGLGAIGGEVRLSDSAMNLSNPAPVATGSVAAGQAGENSVISNNMENPVEGVFTVGQQSGYTAVTYTAGQSPVAEHDRVSTYEGGSINIDVLANDQPYGATPELVGNGPSHGTLAKTSSGWTYTHSGDESSRDVFIYKLVSSTDEWQPMAGVEVSITPVNDAPVAGNDSVSMKTGQKYEVRVLDNDTDADNRVDLKVTDVDATDFDLGVVTFVDKAVTIAAGEKAGTGNLVYTVSDGQGGSDTANIAVTITAAVSSNTGGGDFAVSGSSSEVTVAGLPPVAKDDTFSVDQGGVYVASIVSGVMANDIENGGSVIMNDYPKNGMVDMKPDGTFTYTHEGKNLDADSFSYTIFNDFGSSTGVVNVIVTAKPQ